MGLGQRVCNEILLLLLLIRPRYKTITFTKIQYYTTSKQNKECTGTLPHFHLKDGLSRSVETEIHSTSYRLDTLPPCGSTTGSLCAIF